jgi:hypothetical protein
VIRLADHDREAAAQLPDDIEQKLLDGQRLRATCDLMERSRVILDEARELVGRWLLERQQANLGANRHWTADPKILQTMRKHVNDVQSRGSRQKCSVVTTAHSGAAVPDRA